MGKKPFREGLKKSMDGLEEVQRICHRHLCVERRCRSFSDSSATCVLNLIVGSTVRRYQLESKAWKVALDFRPLQVPHLPSSSLFARHATMSLSPATMPTAAPGDNAAIGSQRCKGSARGHHTADLHELILHRAAIAAPVLGGSSRLGGRRGWQGKREENR